jgi:prepilin-type processing-associated H-X9-DG protein
MGELCPFSHDIQGNLVMPKTLLGHRPITDMSLAASTWARSTPSSREHDDTKLPRHTGGATVTFADGASVSTISLISDFSAVSTSDLSQYTSVQDVVDLLSSRGFPQVTPDCIRFKHIPEKLRKTAVIKVRDPDFANRLLQCLGDTPIRLKDVEVHVSKMQLGGETESGMNRLQLTGVTCSWFNPSKVAYLQYETDWKARRALERIKGVDSNQLMGRRLDVTYQPVQSLQVGNLDLNTNEAGLRHFLPSPQPIKVTWGPQSHMFTAKQLEERAITQLRSYGTLIEECTPRPQKGRSRTKIIAKFSEAEAARNAVKKMHDTRLDPDSNDKMQVTPLVSIKLSVSSRILAAIRPQLDPLVDQTWRTNYVQIKSYEALGKQYAQVRISGQSREPVAKAKSAVEKLLAGQIAVDGNGPITDPFYFRPSSKSFLDDLGAAHGVFIHQDLRRSVLRLYGDDTGIRQVERALVAKCAELKEQSHTVILDPEALAFALKGGFRQIVAALGKDKVKLDIINNPKRIIVEGSTKDVVQIQEILTSCAAPSLETQIAGLSISGDDSELFCPVCFTPPEAPIKTSCGHFYCSTCLASQCTSADSFPLRCLGDGAVCSSPITLADVKKVLSGTEYDNLLQKSLTSYLRSRTTEFQYCSTPDCDRFYRISNTEKPRTFDCDGCLSSICTSCHQHPHDGLTCEANKALIKAASEGDEELAKWKKDNDVRDCPKCGVPIEKAFGCNHMECISCRIHICWFCMKTFGSGGKTYEHMERAHGSIQ